MSSDLTLDHVLPELGPAPRQSHPLYAAYGAERRGTRLGGAAGALAVHLLALLALLWGGWHAVPLASAARDQVVTSFAVPQAPPQRRPEQVPPGPRQHTSEARRTSASTPPAAPLPLISLRPGPAAPPQAPSPAHAAKAAVSSSASSQVDQTSAPPVIAAPPAPSAAARENVAAQAQAAKADWQARVLGHLRQYRRYPRAAESGGQEGTVTLAITLDRQGRVLAAERRHGSGYAMLDAEALATVRRASPLPPPDAAIPGDPLTIEVPIAFALRDHRVA